ncbi:MAG: hypothetical protein K9L22_06500 [Methylococcaceae bacterium]|nr:hypothetical protein [Methylococcaceae bacterium]
MNYIEDLQNMKLVDLLPKIQKRIMQETSYFGVKTLKNPMDFWATHLRRDKIEQN